MLTVYKYEIPIADRFVLQLPIGAEILHAECQNGVPCLWAKIDTEARRVGRRLYITGTGHPVSPTVRHITSFQQGEFVWHLWE
jgi:hypothetical protein